MTTKPTLRTDEAAEYLAVGKTYLYRLLQTGALKATKTTPSRGGHWLISTKELDRWKQKNQYTP